MPPAPLNAPQTFSLASRYPVAVHYLAAQSTIAEEALALICYLWRVDGPTVLRDIDKAKRGETLN